MEDYSRPKIFPTEDCLKFQHNYFQHQNASIPSYLLLARLIVEFISQQMDGDVKVDAVSVLRCTNVLYIIQMNSSAIFQEESPVGAALFSNLSLLNHSCSPNINIRHFGNYVEEKAIIILFYI